MTDWRWLSEDAVLAMHEALINEHGGLAGVRDQGLLDSALARPKNLMAYAEPSAAELAAAYGAGIVRNHPFVDGNKRTGLMTMFVFLKINGFLLTASEVEAVFVFQDLAAGEIGEDELTAWITNNIQALDDN